MRRDFHLPEEDRDHLNAEGLVWEAVAENGMQWFLLHTVPVPSGYNVATVTVAVQIPPGYPDTALDMAYFYPTLARADGRMIRNTESIQVIEGKSFQRWSRHRTGVNPWQPGVDCLANHLLLVRDWLAREFEAR